MRILFISQYFYPEQFSNNSIALAMLQRGHEITVVPSVPNYPKGTFFAGYSNKARRIEKWNGIKIHRARTVARGTNSLRLVLNYLTYPFTAFWVIMQLKPKQYEVSFTSMPSPLTQSIAAILAKWIYRIPCVYWVQDIWPDSAIHILGIKNRWAIKILNSLCGWMYRRADVLLVQSEAFRSKIEGFGVEPSRIRFLPNTAPTLYRLVTEGEVPSNIKSLVDSSKFNVMFAGNIGEAQDLDSIIAAAELLRNIDGICFLIVGSGRYQKMAEAKVVEAGLLERVKFLGRYSENDMPYLFALADVMLVTLKDNPVFRLTVPYKIQCYMACGRAIIAGINGEGSEVVQRSKAGLSVAAECPKDLAAAILRFKNMETKDRRAMEENARSYYEENYDNKVTYDILENALCDAFSN